MELIIQVLVVALMSCVILVLVLGLLGYPYPESDLFAGVVGFSMREITQCLNNFYNQQYKAD